MTAKTSSTRPTPTTPATPPAIVDAKQQLRALTAYCPLRWYANENSPAGDAARAAAALVDVRLLMIVDQDDWTGPRGKSARMEAAAIHGTPFEPATPATPATPPALLAALAAAQEAYDAFSRAGADQSSPLFVAWANAAAAATAIDETAFDLDGPHAAALARIIALAAVADAWEATATDDGDDAWTAFETAARNADAAMPEWSDWRTTHTDPRVRSAAYGWRVARDVAADENAAR